MKARPAKALTAGHDLGGLRLLAPLLRAWRDDARFAVEFIGTPMVCREMEAQVPGLVVADWASGLTEHVCANGAELDTYLDRTLATGAWDLVLTSTSRVSLLEKRLLKVARARGLRTVAFCDMWWAYEERFRDGAEWCAPDTVLVIDERMAEEIARIRWPTPPAVVVAGSPLFQELAEMRALRDVPPDGAIRFISEPASSKFPWSRIDEFQLVDELVSVVRGAGITRRVVVRTHPADAIEPWRRLVWRLRHLDVHLDSMPLRECLVDTAQAVGISSMLLSETAMCGIPTASLQWPGTDPSYYCLPFRAFDIATIHSRADLRAWLLGTTDTAPAPRLDDIHRDSIGRISRFALAASGVDRARSCQSGTA